MSKTQRRLGFGAIIGLSGYAQAGKDTVADILVADHGFKKIAFADALRACVFKLNPIVAYNPVGGEPVRVQDAITAFGYESAKREISEFRRILQVFGTEVVRETFGEDAWVNLVRDTIISEDFKQSWVIPDVRFPNEAEMIEDQGGSIVRVWGRVGRSEGAHASETSMDEHYFDAYIPNMGSLEDLKREVGLMLLDI